MCPNLVQLQGFSKKSGVINIYSEWCQGGDVQVLTRGGGNYHYGYIVAELKRCSQ